MRTHRAAVAIMAALTVLCPCAATALHCGCGASQIDIQPAPIVPVGDGGDLCARACAKLADNGCAAGRNPSCASACRRDQAQGAASQLDVQCVLDAPALTWLRECGVACP